MVSTVQTWTCIDGEEMLLKPKDRSCKALTTKANVCFGVYKYSTEFKTLASGRSDTSGTTLFFIHMHKYRVLMSVCTEFSFRNQFFKRNKESKG